jgi:hypothetical protein
MHNKFRTIFLLTASLFTIQSCNLKDRGADVTEADYIEYKVIYMENMAGDIPTQMLPDVMEAYYNKRYIRTSIEGFFGQFSLVQIANLRQNTVTTMLNFFGNRVFYTGKKGELPVGIKELTDPVVRLTNDTTHICGMLSKMAVVETKDSSFDIYYIEDFDIQSPNITTPYYFIEHVLSDFRVQLSLLKMQLIMRHHEKITVESSVFEIPENYKPVSRETMESIINSLFTKD